MYRANQTRFYLKSIFELHTTATKQESPWQPTRRPTHDVGRADRPARAGRPLPRNARVIERGGHLRTSTYSIAHSFIRSHAPAPRAPHLRALARSLGRSARSCALLALPALLLLPLPTAAAVAAVAGLVRLAPADEPSDELADRDLAHAPAKK